MPDVNWMRPIHCLAKQWKQTTPTNPSMNFYIIFECFHSFPFKVFWFFLLIWTNQCKFHLIWNPIQMRMPFSWKGHSIESPSVLFLSFFNFTMEWKHHHKTADNFYFQRVLLADERESKMIEVEEFLELSYGINCE